MREKISARASRVLAPLTLALWGALLTYFYCSHRLTGLLHPYFHLPVLATGFLLLVASVCVVGDAGEPEAGAPGECCESDCGHFHPPMSLGRWLVFLVLLVPLSVAAWISPDRYSQVLVRNRGFADLTDKAPASVAVATVSASAPLSQQEREGAPIAVEVGDLLMASQSAPGMKLFAGKRVALTGQVFPLGPQRFELVRMLMLCCAADAQILAVRVDARCSIPAMGWAKVTGCVSFERKGDREAPVITAEQVTPTQAPADPYVYRGGSLPAPAPHPRGQFKIQLPGR